MHRSTVATRSAFIAVLLSTGATLAQPATSFPLERLRITPDRSGLIDVEWGRVMPHLQWDLGVHLGYARNPLTVYQLSDNQRLGALVSERVGGSVYFGIAFFDWVQLSAELPYVVYQRGDTTIPGVTLQPLPAIQTLGVGDLRLVPKVRLLRSDDAFVDLAVQLSIYLPLGGGSQYFGDRTVILAPEAMLSRAFGGFRIAGNIGAWALRRETSIANLSVGNELQWRIGAGFRFHEHDKSWIPLELDASFGSSTSLTQPYRLANQSAMEARLQAGWHFENGVLPFIGGGVGLSPGWGSPDWRVYAGIRFGAGTPAAPVDSDKDGLFDPDDACPQQPGIPELKGCPEKDSDGDGLLDRVDRCPKEPEDKDGFEDTDGCIDPDDDKDGILDAKDKCRLNPEDKDNFQDDDGCPDPDNDNDGVLDTADACPMEPGVVEMRGCPDKDTDGDGIVDRLDNCPKEKGTQDNNGCAKKQLVVLTNDKLQILDSVYFQLNKAIIETRSYPLLDNVAKIITDHPEISLVRVEGHTDSQGDDVSNMKLSQARAEAVRDYLTKKGVASNRLKPIGFGETKPIADNATKEGRARNRRVEFNLGDDASSNIKKEDKGPGSDTLER
jgi:outer membrane protein OmpA-like peptidoglycan-associated protein/opacity protein-like surface antigen